MTEKEMLKLEEDNYTTMHLHLVGIFWRAYQRSALGICIMLIGFVFSVSAQVATTVSGYPVVDLSGLSSLGCVLSSDEASSRRTLMNTQTPSNSAYLGVGSAVSCEDGTWNEKMSGKYQVMRADRSTSSTWADAWNSCKLYNGEGGTAGSWRLPTQRELQMIWVLHPHLIGNGSFTAFTANYYWNSTENLASSAWYVNFSNGFTGYSTKTSNYRVRCVRDL